MTSPQNLRLIRHGEHPSAPWSLLQQLADTGSHKRAIWIPIKTQISPEQAHAWLNRHAEPSISRGDN